MRVVDSSIAPPAAGGPVAAAPETQLAGGQDFAALLAGVQATDPPNADGEPTDGAAGGPRPRGGARGDLRFDAWIAFGRLAQLTAAAGGEADRTLGARATAPAVGQPAAAPAATAEEALDGSGQPTAWLPVPAVTAVTPPSVVAALLTPSTDVAPADGANGARVTEPGPEAALEPGTTLPGLAAEFDTLAQGIGGGAASSREPADPDLGPALVATESPMDPAVLDRRPWSGTGPQVAGPPADAQASGNPDPGAAPAVSAVGPDGHAAGGSSLGRALRDRLAGAGELASRAAARRPAGTHGDPAGLDRPVQEPVQTPSGRALGFEGHPLDAPEPARRAPGGARDRVAGQVVHVAAVVPPVSSTAAPAGVAATAPLVGTHAAEEGGPGDLSAQIVSAIRVQWQGAAGDARIRLQPGYLGELSVALRVEQGAVVARLSASSPEVRQWIEAHEGLLRQSLAQHDLTLERLVVEAEETERSRDDHDQSAHQQSEQQSARRRARRSTDATFEVVV